MCLDQPRREDSPVSPGSTFRRVNTLGRKVGLEPQAHAAIQLADGGCSLHWTQDAIGLNRQAGFLIVATQVPAESCH